MRQRQLDQADAASVNQKALIDWQRQRRLRQADERDFSPTHPAQAAAWIQQHQQSGGQRATAGNTTASQNNAPSQPIKRLEAQDRKDDLDFQRRLTKEVDKVLNGANNEQLASYLNFITAEGWDTDHDGFIDTTAAQKVSDLFHLVSGGDILADELIKRQLNTDSSQFTIEWLKHHNNNIGRENTNDPAELAKIAIEDIQIRAEYLGIDLGNVKGRTLEEINALFIVKLQQLKLNTLVVVESYGQTNADDLQYDINAWSELHHTFHVSADVTPQVIEWAAHNFAFVDRNNPQQVEQMVRAYLYNQILTTPGTEIDLKSLDSKSVSELTTLLEIRYFAAEREAATQLNEGCA